VVVNPYIALELDCETVQSLRNTFKDSFKDLGFELEDSSDGAHVSIAYVEGTVSLRELHQVASELKNSIDTYTFEQRQEPVPAKPFQVSGVEILPGLNTPYDYLVLTFQDDRILRRAVEIVGGRLDVRNFAGGFRGHISILKFRKGFVKAVKDLVALFDKALDSLLAAKLPSFNCKRISVFDGSCQCRLSVPLALNESAGAYFDSTLSSSLVA
jgi:hypothetical protein